MSAPGKLTIETPEQIALEFTLASVGSRFLALALDTLIQMTAILLVVLVMWAVGLRVQGAGSWIQAAALLGIFVLYYGYFAAFEVAWSGQTPGKRFVGLRALSITGRPLSAYEALLRNVVRVADQLPGIYAIGILFVLVTERHQRLGDLAAATVVVHEQPIEEQGSDGEERTARGRHGAHRLSPEEIAVIETFLRRRAELSAYARLRASRQVAARIAPRLGVTATGDEERFLEEVLAEYRAAGRYR